MWPAFRKRSDSTGQTSDKLDKLARTPSDETPATRSSKGETSRASMRRPSEPCLSSLPMGMLDLGSAPNPLGDGEEAAAEGLTLRKLGMLTKLSKGGFTANWNRRGFALLGSSLYFAHSTKHLAKPGQAKLFCELAGGAVRLVPESAVLPPRIRAPTLYLLVIAPFGGSVGEPRAGHEENVLLLAADTSQERDEWASALERALALPPCPAEMVACLVEAGEEDDSDAEEGSTSPSSNSKGSVSDRPADRPAGGQSSPSAWMTHVTGIDNI